MTEPAQAQTSVTSVTSVRDLFEAVVSRLGPRVAGRERSLTLCARGCHDQRWLIGLDKQGVDPDALLSLVAALGPPAAVSRALCEAWSAANFVYFAIEDDVPAEVKLYLEFPVLLSTRSASGFTWADVALWCRGYKWRAGGDGHRVTDYRMVSGATLADVQRYLPEVSALPPFVAILFSPIQDITHR